MKDSEILERLIYRAYVAPATRTLEDAAFVPLAAALRLYARLYALEAAAETEDQPEPACADACPVEYPEPQPVPDPDTPPEPEPADTHTHTPPGPIAAKPERLPTSPDTEQAKSGRSTPSSWPSSPRTASAPGGRSPSAATAP